MRVRPGSARSSSVLSAALLLAASTWVVVPSVAAASPMRPGAAAAPALPGAVLALSGVRRRLAAGARGPSATSRTSYDAGTQIAARRATCLGRRATIVGTRKGDRIRGTRGPDVIVGGGGADRISGRGGNDRICGAAGSDYVVPGGGNDRVDGGLDADTLAVSAGRDRLAGGSGPDWLDYRSSRKGATVSLAAGRATGERWSSMENLVGSRFADRLTGSSGSNQLRGGSGNDVLAGGDGEDMLIGQSGDDTLDGGAGALDFVAYPTAPGAVTADLAAGRVTGEGTDGLVGVEGVAGSRHADTLYGGSAASILSGGPGNDTIVGTGTTDILLPMVRGARVDLLGRTASGEGSDTVTGIEVVVGTPGDDVLSGSDADEIFLAGGGADSVSGGGGSDILLGGDGADALAGGTGDDVLRGDQSVDAADRLDGGDGADVADYGASASGVAVSLATGTGPSGDSIGGVETVSGSEHADVISGDAGNNTLMGGPGDDAIAGGAGNDVISGGAGVDALSGEAGADYLTGDEAGGSANGGPDSDVCVDLSPATGCEAAEFVGGTAPGGGTVAGARPAQQTGAARSARAMPLNARLPMTDWFGPGNPAVSCNDGLPSTSSVITGYLPARVRPDYASGNQQTVWIRPEIFDLTNPNTPVETGQWFYNTLNNDQWTTNYWYLYQGVGNDPLDIWRTTFGRNLQTSYAVVYDMWWLDNATGQWLSHDRVRAWHQLGNGLYSDRCAGQAVGYFSGAPSATTPTCAYNWTATWCATFRALNASYETPFNYPTTTFRARPGGPPR